MSRPGNEILADTGVTASKVYDQEAQPNGDIGSSAQQYAQTYLEEYGKELHPALDARFQKSENGNGIKAADPWDFKHSTYVYTQEFLQVIEAYRSGEQDPRIRALAVSGFDSWDSMMQMAREVEEKYLSDGATGPRKLMRRGSDYSSLALPYVRMLPNDTFFSAISGGLRLVFEAGAKLSEKREAALRSLVRIPDVILQAEEACNNFGRHAVLLATCEQLYVAALAVLQGTIKWLAKKAGSKPLQALMLGPVYNKRFQEKMLDLDAALEAMQTQIGGLRDNSISRTAAGVKEMQVTLEKMEYMQNASKTAIEQMKEVLADTTKTARWMQRKDKDIDRLQRRINELECAAASMSIEEFWDLIDVPEGHASRDWADVRKRTDAVSQEFQIALAFLNKAEFKYWLRENSNALLIEGPLPSSTRRVSSFTIMTSSLIQHVGDLPDAVALYYFCGYHDNASDQLYGPQGMLRSLISQLLRNFDVNLEFMNPRLRSLVEKLNLAALGECFGKLIKQLPPRQVVFCLIDGISFLEKRVYIEDTVKAIGDLYGLGLDNDTQANFKLLVTSPGRTRVIGSIFQEKEERMSMRNDDSRLQVSERDVMLATRREPIGFRGPRNMVRQLPEMSDSYTSPPLHAQSWACESDDSDN